jgi:hypothetical protein
MSEHTGPKAHQRDAVLQGSIAAGRDAISIGLPVPTGTPNAGRRPAFECRLTAYGQS